MAYIGNRPLVGRYQVLDNITFNGSNTQYSLTVGGQAVLPGSAQNLLISVGGVLQAPSNAYSVSGSNILFTGAPAANAAFFGVQLGDVFGVATVANTGYTSLRQQFTASNGQTQFAISGGYVPGQVDVYRNGIKLVNGQDTNISSGANVVLSSAAANNDTIDVIGAQQITIGGATTMIRQQFTTANNQTQFAITNGYTPGMIDVYLNGIKQIPGTDVNVSSGSNVVFNVATVNNSVVDVSGYQALSVYNGYTFRSGDTMTGTLTAPAFYADNGATDVAGYLHAQPTMRNRIINGDMRIDQRNAGASVTVNSASGVYTLDRWYGRTPNSAGVFTVQQSSTAPTSFRNSLLCTVTTAATPAASDIYYMQQRIEGFNVADLMLGTANAKSFTISFWVRSSVTGNFGASVGNNIDQSYPFNFTINSANTFEQKTVTIPGSTSGTWNTSNGQGLVLSFSIGAGSSVVGTVNTWGNYPYAPTGSVNLISTNGATFYITGVQLESGSYATPFERRLYNMELMMCQRYYWKFSAAASGGYQQYCIMSWESANAAWGAIPLKVSMRARPSMTVYGSLAGTPGPTIGTLVLDTNQTGTEGAGVGWSAGGGATVGYSTYVRQSNNPAGYLDFSAEL